MTVADAAPTSPKPATPTSTKSSTILVAPAATVKQRPSLGFSAAIKKLWNRYCSMNAVWNVSKMRP